MTRTPDEHGWITRDNLVDAVDRAIILTNAARAEFTAKGGHYLTGYYIDLAMNTLHEIQTQLNAPVAERNPRPTHFGARFVQDMPEFDKSLAGMILKIEDVYRRWHQHINAR